MLRKLVLLLVILIAASYCRAKEKPAVRLLDGIWAFKSGQFVAPEEVSSIEWDSVRLPGNWNSYTSRNDGPFGYGTFYQQLIMPDIQGRPAIRLPDVHAAHRVYLNGELLYESGTVGDDRASEEYGNYRIIQLLPEGLTTGDTLSLVIHVSNFHHRTGGIVRSVEIGPYEVMLQLKQTNLFREALQLGGVGIMGLFFLTYFLFRNKDKYIISFILLCLGVFTYVFFNAEYVLFSLFPELNGAVVLDLIYVAFYFTVTINLILIAELFPDEIPYWLIQIAKIIGLLSILIVILTPMYIYSYTMPVFRVYAVVSGLYLIYRVLLAALHNRPSAKIIWIAITVIFLFMLNDLLYSARIINTGEFIGWGVLFYLMILMIVSSRRFSKAITNEERLLQDLKKLNDNLTYKVKERTQDLEDKSRIIAEQQKQILRKNQELIKSREEEKNMLKNIVHDLKAPFNKISGLMNVLQLELQKNPDNLEEREKIMQMIRNVADEGGSMVEDLNIVTFFEDTLFDGTDPEEADLMQLLNDLILGYRGYAEKKQIQLQFTAPVKKYLILTRPKSLTRVVDNLISNAIKFSPPDTRVWVTLHPYHDYFEISVKDEGPGFTDEDKTWLFEKFRKLSARPTSGESSTGLGLNIVKTLTESMGGEVRLTETQRGAHFKLKFPRKLSPAPQEVRGDE